MKYINKISVVLSLLAVVLFSSCEQDNEGAVYTEGSGLTFVSSALSGVTVSPDAPVVVVDILRSNGAAAESGELTMTATIGKDAFDGLTVTGYNFAAGETKTTVTIDATALAIGAKAIVSLALNTDDIAIDGVAETTISITKDYSWEPMGTGVWTDGLICTIFNVQAGVQWEVEVEKAVGFDVYRMVNAYGFEVCPWTAESEVTVNPCYIMVDATDPNAVFVPEASMGIDWTYGEFYVGSIYGQLSASPSYTLGTKNGNIIDLGMLYTGMGSDYGPYVAKTCILELPE